MLARLIVALLVCGACGDDGGVHHLADAPPAPDDAPMFDASTAGPVSLAITRFGDPQVGVDVYFQAADGTLVSHQMTDAAGVATAVMEPGGYVSAVNPFRVTVSLGKGNEVRTFMGVKPGDHLVLHLGSVFVSVTVSAPIDPAAAAYEVYSSCGGTSSTALPTSGSGSAPAGTMSLSGCGSSADFAVVTRDGNGNALHALTKTGVTVTDGGTVDLTAETYADLTGTQLMFSGAPAETTALLVDYLQASARGPMYSTGSFIGLEGGAGTITVSRPAGGVLGVVDTRLDPPGVSEQHVVDWAPPAATLPISLASGALPAYTAAPAVDVATHTVSWMAGAGATPDGELVSMSFARDGTPTIAWSWIVSAPYTGTTLVLPKLDVSITQFNPIAGDNGDIEDLLTAKVPGGYDVLRAALQSSDGPAAFVAGASGRLAYTHLNFQVVSRKR